MKPLLVVATLLSGEGPTGVETHFRQIVAAAREQGLETKVVTPYTVQRRRRAPFRPLKNLHWEWSQVAYRRGQEYLLRSQLAQILHRSAGRSITVYAQCPLSARAALSIQPRHGVRVVMVVHYNDSEAEEVVGRGIAKRDGIWWRHLAALERETLPRLDGIAFVSDYMRRVVNDRVRALIQVPQVTIFNFPPPVSPSEVQVPPERDLISIGTLEPRKNQQFILHVLAAAKRLGFSYTLSLVGHGPDRPKLEALARELGVDAQVRFLGFQAEAHRLISKHRALVHAAVAENCPLIISEALSRGRPVLAGPVGGIPELYEDGVEGNYWDLDDPDGGALKLAALLENSARYEAASVAARARFERVFVPAPRRWLEFLFPWEFARGKNVGSSATDAHLAGKFL